MTIRAASAYYIGLLVAFFLRDLLDALLLIHGSEGEIVLPLLLQPFDFELIALRALYAVLFYIAAFVAIAKHDPKRQFWVGLAVGALSVVQYALMPNQEPGVPMHFLPELLLVGAASLVAGANRRWRRDATVGT